MHRLIRGVLPSPGQGARNIKKRSRDLCKGGIGVLKRGVKERLTDGRCTGRGLYRWMKNGWRRGEINYCQLREATIRRVEGKKHEKERTHKGRAKITPHRRKNQGGRSSSTVQRRAEKNNL